MRSITGEGYGALPMPGGFGDHFADDLATDIGQHGWLWELVGQDLGRYVYYRLLLNDSLATIGRDTVDRLNAPVPHMRAKRAEMTAHLRDPDGEWLALDADIPWIDQVRIIQNGRGPFLLLGWTPDDRIDFEQDARRGYSIRKLGRDYHLPYHLARNLVRMFRGGE
jgi:hypothetical protein